MSSSEKNITSKITANFQIWITLIYLFAIGLGMLFNYYKYYYFKINIFDYASVFDFLIAPFADFRILAFTILTISATYLIYLVDNRWKNKYPKSYSYFTFDLDRYFWYKKIRIGLISILFLMYILNAASLYGKMVKKEIINQQPITISYVDNQTEKGFFYRKNRSCAIYT